MSKVSTSEIATLEELQIAIANVELRIQVAESEIRERWDRLPEESVKAATGSLLTLVLSSSMASGLMKLASTIVGVFGGKKDSKEGKKNTLSGIGKSLLKMGFLPIIELIFNILKRKKAS